MIGFGVTSDWMNKRHEFFKRNHVARRTKLIIGNYYFKK